MYGESDATIAAKASSAADAGLVPIICVGETADERGSNETAQVPLAQLEAALASFPAEAKCVIAYEPVWAIGSGEAATPEQAEAVCALLRERLVELRGASAAQTRILYGGSVSSQNIAGFVRQLNIDGALVGGASLDSEEFAKIVQFRKHVVS